MISYKEFVESDVHWAPIYAAYWTAVKRRTDWASATTLFAANWLTCNEWLHDTDTSASTPIITGIMRPVKTAVITSMVVGKVVEDIILIETGNVMRALRCERLARRIGHFFTCYSKGLLTLLNPEWSTLGRDGRGLDNRQRSIRVLATANNRPHLRENEEVDT